jgi:hypothetical protein
MGVDQARFKRIGEHLVDEAQQHVEGLGRSLEHMFVSLRTDSDGRGVSQGILHGRGAATTAERPPPEPLER